MTIKQEIRDLLIAQENIARQTSSFTENLDVTICPHYHYGVIAISVWDKLGDPQEFSATFVESSSGGLTVKLIEGEPSPSEVERWRQVAEEFLAST